MNLKNTFQSTALLLGAMLPLAYGADAQISSGNAFIKGNFVEVGMSPCGSFGSSVAPPSGYHQRGDSRLGFVADPGKDGWATGTPNYVGDYFLPGSPEEGWGLSVNGASYNNNQVCGQTNINGSVISYNSSATEVSATWQGSVAGLSITARTYVPVNSVYFVTEVKITNTSAATINNVFYMRNVDPDHGVYTPGASGSYTTNNSIVYQNDACNRSLATATTLSGGNYLGLGSIDSRARVTTGGFSNRSAAAIWNGSGFYTSGTRQADEAISISFNLGNLAPNQTATFAYAYILSAADLTTALAATNVGYRINSVTYTSGTPVNVCYGDSVEISLVNADAYPNWSWTPGTNLDQTSGKVVRAYVNNQATYTVSGSGTCGTVGITIPLVPLTAGQTGNAGAITGPASINLGQTGLTYSIAPVTNASHYNWVLPPGSVVTSASSKSNSITFNASNTPWCGDIKVTPANDCNSGAPALLAACMGNQISTSAIASPACAGSGFNVAYGLTGMYNTSNVFTAQLSNASGSFSNPVAIGTLNSAAAGSIPVTIPAGTMPGNGYRIRVVSSSPAVIGTPNSSNITVNSMPAIQCTGNQTVSTSANGCTAVVNYSATASGTPAPAISYTFSGATTGNGTGTGSGMAFNKGITNVTLTAANGCSPASSCSFTVTVEDNQAPVLECPAPIAHCDDAAGNSHTLTLQAGDNCGIASTTYAITGATTGSGEGNSVSASFAVGTSTITWTVTDGSGNISTCATNVNIWGQPVLSLTGNNISCFGGSNGSITSAVTGGTAPYQYLWTPGGATTANRSGLPAGTYAVQVTDAHGCATSGTQSLTQPTQLVVGSITGSPAYTVTACNQYTIYLGYGLQSINLSVSPVGGTGAYAYSWSSPSSVTSPASATTAVSPVTSTVYNVTVTDANGCVATSNASGFHVRVKDVRCGNNNDKVLVCHNGNNAICISPNAVPAHLSNHGDCLGDCTNTFARNTAPVNRINLEEGEIVVFPNPAHGKINVELKETGSAYKSYQITDINGRLISSGDLAEGIHQDLITIDVSNLVPGIYIIRAVTDKGASLTKFTVE